MIGKPVLFHLACIPLFIFLQAKTAEAQINCDFSRFKPRRMSHFAERMAITKIKPQYPPAAEAKGISGTIQIKILVNKNGFVERTCPLYISGVPKPDRGLAITAEAAALQWIFRPNFGLTVIGELQLNFVEDILIFEFNPEQRDKKEVKNTENPKPNK
jgi:hypothetical protein